ncbi:MAG TPA: sarcosine oxidase subunit delta [Acetobacteraceae bacterium]
MLRVPCPICGPRPEAEFAYGGEAGIARPAEPTAVDDADWAAFLHGRTNPKGAHGERWRHVHGCGRFFSVRRDTISDRFLP